jgi:hypothetical protein
MFHFTNNDRTGSAITLGTTFLGAGAMQVFTQMLQQRACRRSIGDLLDLALVVETYRVRHECSGMNFLWGEVSIRGADIYMNKMMLLICAKKYEAIPPPAGIPL